MIISPTSALPGLRINASLLSVSESCKWILAFVMGLLCVGTASAVPKYRTLAIGKASPNWELPGVDGKTHRLKDYADKDALMVGFLAGHCPTSQSVGGGVKKIVTDFKDESLALVAISGNSPPDVEAREMLRSIFEDSFESMVDHAAMYVFNFPFLYDGDTQEVTMAFGARATPHVFNFDKDCILRYEGRLDDTEHDKQPTQIIAHCGRW
ncbi:MAG: redoxin domain-containing protein [Verrucomicrobiota bacterium]